MRIAAFAGMMPGIAPSALPPGHAEKAVNCYIGKGDALQPERAPVFLPFHLFDVNGNIFTGTPRTLWRSGSTWVAWDKWVHVCHDPRKWSSPHAFLFVDEGQLYRSSDVWVAQKKAPQPVGLYRPTSFPAVVNAAQVMKWAVPNDDIRASATGDCPASCPEGAQPGEARSYVFTWVNDMLEESPPSNPSTPVLVGPDDVMMVTDTSADIPANVVAWRWYRALPGEKTITWRFAGETTGNVFTDDVDPLGLGDELETLDHYPAGKVDGVAAFGAASVIVWSADGRIWASEEKLPHAFPPISEQRLPYRIVTVRSTPRRIEDPTANAMPAVSNIAYVLTDGRPFKLEHVPNENGATATPHEYEIDEPVLAPWAACSGEGLCFYASSRGIVCLNGEAVDSPTDQEFTREAWTAIQPETYAMAYNQGRIFMVRSDGGYVVVWSSYQKDRTHSVSETSFTGTALWSDARKELVSADKESTLKEFAAAQHYMEAVWTSRTWQAAEYWSPGALKVDTDFHLVWDSKAEDTWRAFQDWIKTKGACSAHDFWKAYPCFLPYRKYIDFRLSPPVVELFCEGQLYCREEIRDQKPFRLPRLGKGIYWSLRIRTRYRVLRIAVEKAIQDIAAETQPQEIL